MVHRDSERPGMEENLPKGCACDNSMEGMRLIPEAQKIGFFKKKPLKLRSDINNIVYCQAQDQSHVFFNMLNFRYNM